MTDIWKIKRSLLKFTALLLLAVIFLTSFGQTDVNAADIETPYGCDIYSIDDSGITYYWKKVDHAAGYIIYRSYTKRSGYEEIASVQSTANTYVDNSFDHSVKKVYYRVKAVGKNGTSAFSEIVAAKYRTSMVIEISNIFLRSGSSRHISVYEGWGNAEDVIWYSSDETIATVSENGTIEAKSAGSCTVYCEKPDSGEKLECNVTVDRRALEPFKDYEDAYSLDSDGIWKQTAASGSDSAVIMLTGDMMCTSIQIRQAVKKTNTYDFSDSFKEIKPIIESADYAFGNLETTLSASAPYMNEELYVDTKANCNAPSNFLDALKDCGFDGLCTANNHAADAGLTGLYETLDAIDSYSFGHVGTYKDSSESRVLLAEVNGIKVGFLAYVSPLTGYNSKDAGWTEEEVETSLNYYTIERAQQDIAALKDMGAEYIICYMHWGVKNAASLKSDQKNYSQELADAGVDYIVGAHAHLIQPYTEITASDGRSVPCFYSIGDFISSIHQITGNRDSVILRLKLARDESGKVYLAENAYIPCICYTLKQGNPYYVSVLKDPTSKAYRRVVSEVGDGISIYDD